MFRLKYICTLFDSLISTSRTPCAEIDHKQLNDLKVVISLCLNKWRNRRFSTKMIKIHWVEDYLFKQIEKFNGIDYSIEDCIEQAHQLGMLDKKTGKMRDRKNLPYTIQQMNWYS